MRDDVAPFHQLVKRDEVEGVLKGLSTLDKKLAKKARCPHFCETFDFSYRPDVLCHVSRVISDGVAEGVALVSSQPIGFLGGVDPGTGVVVEPGHPLEGECVAGRILVFPTGKGSTVGSYTLYRLKGNGKAPLALVNNECEAIVAVGAIISEIPCVDGIDVERIKEGDLVEVDGDAGTVLVEK